MTVSRKMIDVDTRLFAKGDRVLCAVSGGADSMVLLDVLLKLSEELGIQVFAAHYEHGIRDHESQRDASFAEEKFRALGVQYVIGHGNVPEEAEITGRGIEETARDMRYAFLRKTAEKFGCSKIATAHNSCDNAETVLFNLARGSGIKGLCGIPEENNGVVRPLLRVSREEIESYAADNGIEYVTDSSNLSDDYSRNRIRHNAVPVFRTINREFEKAVSRCSELLKRDDDYLESVADDFLKRELDGCCSVSAERLLELPYSISSRAIMRLCPQNLSFEHVQSVLNLCSGSESRSIDLPGITVHADTGRVYFGELTFRQVTDSVISPGETINIGAGMTLFAEYGIYDGEINGLFTTFALKCESISGTLRCTAREDGDRIRLSRRQCTKTLKSLFLEKAVPQYKRQSIPVIRDDSGVLAVYGMGIDERAEPEKGDRILKIIVTRGKNVD